MSTTSFTRRRALALGASTLAVLIPRAARADPPAATSDLLPPGACERFELPNGLDVALQCDRATTMAAVHVRYDVGAGDDPDGYRGLAHLAEHLSYGPTRHAPDGLLEAVDALGATAYNGVTEVDCTRFFATVHAAALERLLWIESERMAFALEGITPAQLEREKAAVCNEHAERVEGDPASGLRDAIDARVYPSGHRYRRDGDEPDDVRAVSPSDAQWFMQRWYVPANAHLAVVGNFDVASARRMVERYFASIPRQPRPAPLRVATSVRRAETLAYQTLADLERASLRWNTPPLWERDDAALDLVANVLERRLERALIDRGSLAFYIGAEQISRPAVSQFVVSASGRPEVHADALRGALRDAHALLYADGVSDDDFVSALRAQELKILERASNVTDRAAAAARCPDASDLGWHRRNLARYASLQTSDLRRVVREHLDPARCLTVEQSFHRWAPMGGRVATRTVRA